MTKIHWAYFDALNLLECIFHAYLDPLEGHCKIQYFVHSIYWSKGIETLSHFAGSRASMPQDYSQAGRNLKLHKR